LTNPKILSTQFSNVIIQRDTVLDFTVQLGIFEYSLCYMRTDTLLLPNGESYGPEWDIFLSNNTGTKRKNITKWEYTDYEPLWSPNGDYIAFWREKPASVGMDRDLYLYNTYKDTLIGLLPSDTSNTVPTVWTHDSKDIIFYNTSHINGKSGYFIVNVDGNNCRKLKYPVSYLYHDDYNTIFSVTQSSGGTSVYHSNLDGSVLDSIVDLTHFVKTQSGGVSIHDYDPNANELLLGFDDPSTTLPNMFAKYNITEKRLDTVIVSDSGWKYYNPKFSNDFKKIAFKEVNVADTVNYTNRISVLNLENHIKTVVVEFPHKNESGKYQFIDSSPVAFSPDDKYLAFSKGIYQQGTMAQWILYLYLVELETRQLTFIDIGKKPQWNPKKEH